MCGQGAKKGSQVSPIGGLYKDDTHKFYVRICISCITLLHMIRRTVLDGVFESR